MGEKFQRKAPDKPKVVDKPKGLDKPEAVAIGPVATFDKMDAANREEIKFKFDDYLSENGYGKSLNLSTMEVSKLRDGLMDAAQSFLTNGVKISNPLVAKTANIVIYEYVLEKLKDFQKAKDKFKSKPKSDIDAFVDKYNRVVNDEREAEAIQEAALEEAKRLQKAKEKKEWDDFFGDSSSPKTEAKVDNKPPKSQQ